MSEAPLRFGTLGAARITPNALIDAARATPGVEVRAIAARSRADAEAFAQKHEVPRVFDDYEALIHADEIDCVYVPLPNGLHCEWTIRALRAGKHVLCEKPIAANADEAQRMERAAQETGRCLVEAAHYLYHPVARRVREILDAGSLGRLVALRSSFGAPFPHHEEVRDIRFDYGLAGGALMDMGFYPVSALRFATGDEPEVLSAKAEIGPPQVDVAMQAELRFPGGVQATASCAMKPGAPFEGTLEVEGERGRLRVTHPFLPHISNRIEIETDGTTQSEELDRTPTFHFQMKAFRDHVQAGAPIATGPEQAVGTMRTIDAIYRAAGLPLRGT